MIPAPTGAIPFNRSSAQGAELDYIAEAMRIGQVAGDQTFSHKCQELVEKALGVRKALVTTSCTHARNRSGMADRLGEVVNF
jgi:dTDP-4-amino-4,6-dideoxygalactose transaminase